MTTGHGTDAIELMLRLGYAARGTVYLIVGGLAVAAAVGRGGEATDTEGALQAILRQPLGHVLLAIVALGLVAFSVWRLIQSLLDTDGHGGGGKGLLIRAGLFVSAAVHAALALAALGLLFGWGSGGSEDSAQDWTAWLMAQPFGRWLVGLAGLAVIGTGLAHMVKGWRADFEKHLDMDARDLRWASPVSRFGLIARGIVFLIVGGFLVAAAVQARSGNVVGLAGALEALQGQPYGAWLLAVVAAGLFAFGLYGLIQSVYRRIPGSRIFPARPRGDAVRAAARP